MNISAMQISPSFGTKIVIKEQDELRDYICDKFPRDTRKKFEEPMCDFWTTINEKTSKIGKRPKNPKPKERSEYLKKKYHIKKNIFGATYDIDICSGGIVLGNNGKVAMFHIAPTIENYDLLIAEHGTKSDYLGSSIDEFAKKSDGIKKVIIVGGKKAKSVREEFSQKVNKLIRARFEKRDIPTTVLSDFKEYLCDLFYRSEDDILDVGVRRIGKNRDIKNIFGEVSLGNGDTINIV